MIWSAKRCASVLLLSLLSAAHLAALEDLADSAQEKLPARYGDRPRHAARAKTAYETDLAKYEGADDVLVLPGLVADRRAKRVEVMAEATGLAAGSIVEFLLIDAGSGKGYEALLWSLARPSDVHRALEFIGMAPGKPFHPAKLRFWSKGERVVASIAAPHDSGNRVVPTRLERLVIDGNTGAPLPEVGFVFAGSFMVDNPGEKPGRAYAADVLDPKSVASIYNDPTAVLDVPRRARKEAVYGSQVVGPQYDYAKHEPVKIILEPEYKDGRRRVVDLVLQVGRSAVKASSEFAGADRTEPAATVQFLLRDAAGKAMTENRQLADVLGIFGALIRQGRDPYVSVRFDAALRLAEVREVCRFLGAIDSETGVRVEPPAPGQLYYEALLPDVELLDRESRIVDPWELHLVWSGEEAKEKITGTLALHESVFVGGRSEAKVTTFELETPEALRRQLDADAARRKTAGRRPGPPILLVFADANLTYGKLVDFLGPALTTHNIVHVFLK
ncbi:MAG TPA: YdjY domain-containing protein [Thermoguttaceae bacterium]|nr:YdjY domain-containing protein [Thermoguttaceae bacterium]